MHEHLLIDARVWVTPSPEVPPADLRVTAANLAYTRWNYLNMPDNLISSDPDAVVGELSRARDFGATGVVDMTNIGLGRRPGELPGIARRSGMHVMVGCGFYVDSAHPEWLRGMSVDGVHALIALELEHGIEDTGIRPALVGEIGTSHPVTERERKVLEAAGSAAAAAGAAVNVHLDPAGDHALEILALLVGAGMPAERVIFSHMDIRLDHAYHRAVAEAGCVLEYDTFGHEFYIRDLETISRQPSDLARCELLAKLVQEGFGDRIVLGCDCGAKATLAAYGGHGHEHLLRRIVPVLELNFGVPADVLETMLVHTPRRLLDRP